MAKRPIQNPHDSFFKQTFGSVDFTRGFLSQYMASDASLCLDLSSLETAHESFVDDDLRQSHSDLVFTVALVGGGQAVVYLLFEHKSHPDPLTVFQLLKYIVRINERRLREGLPLCCVIPLVIYHGPTGWNVARSIDELVAVPAALQRYLPQLSMELFDLSGYDDEQLRGEAYLRATLLLLKYIMRDNLPEELDRIFSLFAEIRQQPRGLDCIKLLLSYLIRGTDRVDSQTLRVALGAALQTDGETLMSSLAEQWTQLGREEGRQEGRQEGELVGQIRLLQEVLSLPVATQETLLELDTEQLQAQLAQLRKRLGRS